MFILVSAALTAIITRVFYLIFWKNGQMDGKESRSGPAKTLIVLGSGGHTTEMTKIVTHLHPEKYSPRVYVRADKDNMSSKKVKEVEQDRKDFKIISVVRSREVHQSYFSSIWSTLYATWNSLSIIWMESPDLLLCNGPGTCVPLCAVAFFLKSFFLSNSKIVFVESFCRVKSLSLSGKILYYFADHVIVQWPRLGKPLCSRSIVV